MEYSVEQAVDDGVSIKKYMVRFGLVHAGLVVLLGVITYFLDIDLGSAPSVIILMCSAMYAVSVFIQDNKRVPNKGEKSRMIWTSFAISWVLSIVVSIGIFLPLIFDGSVAQFFQSADSTFWIIMAIIFFIVILLYIGLLYFCYGMFANKQYQALIKKGKL